MDGLMQTFDYLKWKRYSAGGAAAKEQWGDTRARSREAEAAVVHPTTAGTCVTNGYFPGCTCRMMKKKGTEPGDPGYRTLRCHGVKLSHEDYKELRHRCERSSMAETAIEGSTYKSAKEACEHAIKKDKTRDHDIYVATMFAAGDGKEEWYEAYMPSAVEAGLDEFVEMLK